MASPAFQFYVKQWLGDNNVMLMDWDARGMHLHLMCIAWQMHDPCKLPDDDAVLKKWVGNPSDWETRLKGQIFRAWRLETGFWVQDGLLREYEKQKKFSESRSKNAAARWGKEKPHASAKQVQCKRNALQSSSSSSDNTPIVPKEETLAIDYLNEKTGRSFKSNLPSNMKYPVSLLKKGFTLDDMKLVVDHKASLWMNDEKMSAYLRPETIFGGKFDGYLQEAKNGSAKKESGGYKFFHERSGEE